MALKATFYDAVDYMTEPEDVFHHLDAELESYEPKYLLLGLEDAVRARGGAARMSVESGVSECELTNIASMDEASVLKLAQRLMEAYRPDADSAKVA